LAFSVPTAIAQGTVSSNKPAKMGLGAIGSTSGKNRPPSTAVNPKLCLTFRSVKSLYAMILISNLINCYINKIGAFNVLQ
jgi:hypothetical protein